MSMEGEVLCTAINKMNRDLTALNKSVKEVDSAITSKVASMKAKLVGAYKNYSDKNEAFVALENDSVAAETRHVKTENDLTEARTVIERYQNEATALKATLVQTESERDFYKKSYLRVRRLTADRGVEGETVAPEGPEEELEAPPHM